MMSDKNSVKDRVDVIITQADLDQAKQTEKEFRDIFDKLAPGWGDRVMSKDDNESADAINDLINSLLTNKGRKREMDS